MTRDELRALIRGPMASFPTPFNADLSVDLGAAEALVQWWIDEGVVNGRACVKVNGGVDYLNTTDEEWPALLRTAVRAADGRAPVLCGLRPRNTLHTIDDARIAQDLGAAGVQLDIPFFNFPTQDDVVRHFSDISEAVDIGLVIKNCFWFGAPSLTVESMLRLGRTEHVVAIKWDVPDRDKDYDSMREFAPVVNVIDDSGDPVRCHRNGGRGHVDGWLNVRPSNALRTWDLLEAGQYEEAQALYEALRTALREPGARLAARSGGDRTARGILEVLGWRVGPPRPPTLPLDAGELALLRAALQTLDLPIV